MQTEYHIKKIILMIVLSFLVILTSCNKDTEETHHCSWPAETHYYSIWNDDYTHWSPYGTMSGDTIIFSNGTDSLSLKVIHAETESIENSASMMTPNPECPDKRIYHFSVHQVILESLNTNLYFNLEIRTSPVGFYTQEQGSDYFSFQSFLVSTSSSTLIYSIGIKIPHPPIDSTNESQYLSNNSHYANQVTIGGIPYNDVYYATYPTNNDTTMVYKKFIGLIAYKSSGSWYVRL
jgi:hypothetical protein